MLFIMHTIDSLAALQVLSTLRGDQGGENDENSMGILAPDDKHSSFKDTE